MCGGSGTRLWPASRESMPKQFIPLLDDLSNFQITAKRFDHPAFTKPLIVASSEVRFIAAEQLQAIGLEAEIVLEPMRRDSAAAVAVAACLAARRGPDTVALVGHGLGAADANVYPELSMLRAVSSGDDPEG